VTTSQLKTKAVQIGLSKIGDFTYGPMKISIIDSVADYVTLLESIFDFPLIKSFLLTRSSDFRVLFDGLHGVTGPYARAILVNKFGLPETSLQNCVPLPDFGGGHPDPNLTYARPLVDAVETRGIEFGAASDGDGDRNMIYGKGAFVTPSDSVAIIAHWADTIPYFKKGGVKGLARSMPTSKAIDLVAKKKGLEYFEVPTGKKNFSHGHLFRNENASDRLEVLREPYGRRTPLYLWGRIVRYWVRPYSRERWLVGGRRLVTRRNHLSHNLTFFLFQRGSTSLPPRTKILLTS
jgi:phosphoglucomutase